MTKKRRKKIGIPSFKQTQNKIDDQKKILSVRSESLKEKIKKIRLVSLSIFVGIFILIYFLLSLTTTNSFTCVLTPMNGISFKIKKKGYEFTSPLCGCGKDTFPHDGLLFTGNDIYLKRSSNLPLANYLITAPTPSIPFPVEGFSFNASFYSIVDSGQFKTMNMDQILADTNFYNKHKQTFNNSTYLSIISDQEMFCRMFGKQSNVAFLPADESETNVNVNEDKYEHKLNSIAISNGFNSMNADREIPRIDFLGDSIAIIWEGVPKLLQKLGRWKFLETYPDSLKYINVLLIKSPFATRISNFGWNLEMENFWRTEYLSQFQGLGEGMWFGDIPLLFRNDTGVYILSGDQIKPAEIPNLISKDSGHLNVRVNKLLSNNEYGELYSFYSQREGVWRKLDTSAFMMGTKLTLKDDESINDTLSNYRSQISKVGTDAHELQKLSEGLQSATKNTPIDTEYHAKMKFGNQSLYFRYPPISPENAIIFYQDFSDLEFIGAKGTVNTGGKITPIDQNNLVQFKHLNNCTYNDPPFTMGIGKSFDFQLKGEGEIFIDGEKIEKRFYEHEWALITLSVIGFISFIYSLTPIFKKKNEVTA